MCGIAGTIGVRDDRVLTTMLGALTHRGPDDEGIYRDPDAKIFLGHRRLSIIDVSSAAHQPMSDEHQKIWVTFNGEIYNYKQLRTDLEGKGYVFSSSSDTEVLVHGYAAYGTDLFRKIDGMWAIALYDVARGLLHLSRDPAGIKPLYVYTKGSEVFFASEIVALVKAVKETLPIDTDGVAQFLAHGYIYTDTTIYQNITEIPIATTVTIDVATLTSSSARHYTPAPRRASKGMEETIAEFDRLFTESVRESLQSDVPVGLFLSGGVDSSLIGHYAKRVGASPRAFTIGFERPDFDESDTASRITKHLGLQHTTHILRATDIASDVENIFDSFGEPFADQSTIPTYYVSKLAHEHGYKVALAGDGADELFGGYPTHYLPTLSQLYRVTPRVTDTFLGRLATVFPQGTFTKLGTREKIERFLAGARYPYREAHARWKRIFTPDEYAQLVLPEHQERLAGAEVDFKTLHAAAVGDDKVNEVAHLDFLSFLTANCLVKSDISAMQHGLEVRVPFLNKDMIDFAWHLPSEFKARPFQTKILLRKVLSRALPPEFARLPKQGFSPPISEWLTGELEPVMRRILTGDNIAATGFLSYTYVMSLLKEHLERTHDHGKKLWSLMSLVRFYSKP